MAEKNQKKIGKTAFVDLVAEKANKEIDITKKDTEVVVNAVLDTIIDCMHKETNITIPNFGAFKIQEMKARKGRNIVDNSTIKIPAHKRVKFSAGKLLKEAVASKKKKK